MLKIDRSMIELSEGEDDKSQESSSWGQKFENVTAADGSTSQSSQNYNHKLRKLPEFCTEDPSLYSANEIRNMLDMINEGNQAEEYIETKGSEEHSKVNKVGGGLKPLVKAHGIVGFIRFLDCYYLTLITKKAKVGCIGGHDIYTILDTETIPIKPAESFQSKHMVLDGEVPGTDPHSLLMNMWNRGKRSLNLGLSNRELAEARYQVLYQALDLSKDFFFSYTYDLTQSLQHNVLAMTSKTFPPPPGKDMYCWNYFQTRELEEVTGVVSGFHWNLNIIYGAFIQRKLKDFGRSLNLILLARRSRHFAGTRYLKRGVSDSGKVANDVEHEQLLHDESGIGEGVFASYLQMRGSIPTHWTQESSMTMPKPPIVLNRVDPTYHATQLHFEDLFRRYSSPVIALDLIKQSEKREREVIVGNEYRHAIDYINHHIDDKHKIRYCALDYSHISKHRNLNVSTSLHEVSTWAVNQTGFFCSAPKWKILKDRQVVPFSDDTTDSTNIKYHMGIPIFPMEQKGVLRTNCIDCLDRTNVAQFSAGVEALGQQLVVMGIRNHSYLNPSCNLVKAVIDMYVDIGDHLSLQYGGSEAHKKVQSSGIDTSVIAGNMGKHKELLTSIRRYCSNAFTDRLKQDSMNLFLGHYIPSRHPIPLWEMENDYYLHNSHVQSGATSLENSKLQRQALLDDFNDKGTGKSSRDSILFQRRSTSTFRRAPILNRRDDAKTADEPLQIVRLRKSCVNQLEHFSLWWRIALRDYIDQRRWIQLGNHIEMNPHLPSRFETIHGAADQMVQFDKLLSRPWTKPFRADRYLNIEEEKSELITHRKKVSLAEKNTESDAVKNYEEQNFTLGKYRQEFGYSSESARYMANFLEAQKVAAKSKERREQDESYALYKKYTQQLPEEKKFESRHSKVKEEFTSYLQDLNIKSDDADGLLKLSQGAHINSEIINGPYRGLSQHESAVEVTVVINEQFNVLHTLKEKGLIGNISSGETIPFINDELKRREMDTPGVMHAVYNGWNRFEKAERCYNEVVSSNTLRHGRSDFTDEHSMKLYMSFFSKDTLLTNHDVHHMSGTSSSTSKTENPHVSSNAVYQEDAEESTFMRKARSFNIYKHDFQKSQPPSLFSPNKDVDIPVGFEQINDGLYARKDNRFMVFNYVGIESQQWPPSAVTKGFSLEEDMDLLKS